MKNSKLILLVLLVLFSISLCRHHHKQDEELGKKLPYELPDSNHDGYADQNDFYHAFAHTQQTPTQIYDLFQTADIDQNGKVDEDEWTDFYELFVKPFSEKCDSILGDLVLDANEFSLCAGNVKSAKAAVKAMERDILNEDKWKQLISILSTRERTVDLEGGLVSELNINLAEYIYFRRSALAWRDCTSTDYYITKHEIKGCAQAIMNPFFHVSDNDLNFVWNVGMDLLPRDEVPSDGRLEYVGFVSLFRKFDQFNHYDYNLLRDGTLSHATLMKGINDGKVPVERLNEGEINKLFNLKPDEKYKLNNDLKKIDTGIDFRAFFVLESLGDAISVYGNSDPGTVDATEWEALCNSNFVPYGVLEQIDTIDMDDKEKEEQEKESDKDKEEKQDDLERKLLNPTGGRFGGQFSFLEVQRKRLIKKTLSLHNHHSLMRKHKTQSKSKLDPPSECPECRAQFFKLFSIKKDMVYQDAFVGDKDLALDQVDLYFMWRTIYLFNSYDKTQSGAFYPDADRYHKDFVIPPTRVEKIKIDQMFEFMADLPINPMIFADFLRYEQVFKTLDTTLHKTEKTISKELLEEGLTALGLKPSKLVIGKGKDESTSSVISVKKSKVNDDILEEQDEDEETKPFNWNTVFKLAIKEYANELENTTRPHLNSDDYRRFGKKNLKKSKKSHKKSKKADHKY